MAGARAAAAVWILLLASAILLEQDAWIFVREGEPASCNDCDLQCELTARQLWGAEEAVRYGVCSRCANYERCPLQGRYYC